MKRTALKVLSYHKKDRKFAVSVKNYVVLYHIQVLGQIFMPLDCTVDIYF